MVPGMEYSHGSLPFARTSYIDMSASGIQDEGDERFNSLLFATKMVPIFLDIHYLPLDRF